MQSVRDTLHVEPVYQNSKFSEKYRNTNSHLLYTNSHLNAFKHQTEKAKHSQENLETLTNQAAIARVITL